jgi:hypothetical protein
MLYSLLIPKTVFKTSGIKRTIPKFLNFFLTIKKTNGYSNRVMMSESTKMVKPRIKIKKSIRSMRSITPGIKPQSLFDFLFIIHILLFQIRKNLSD